MEDKNTKNILMVCGVFPGHFTGNVEIIRELVTLGHNVTCYILEEFEERIKDIGAKIVVYNIDINEIKKIIPPDANSLVVKDYLFGKAYDEIFTLLLKDETKYDYYIFDSFFDIQEMNKILKIPIDKFILICTSFIITDQNFSQFNIQRNAGLKYPNEKYNLNLHDFVAIHFIPNKFKKLILTSKLFHLRGESTDETCFFIGPYVEKRKIDKNFKFNKNENKKLIYISLGTIFNSEFNFYSTCIEAFKNSKEYQVIMSVGKNIDIEQFGELPENISIFNYVPQIQLLNYVDIFITHGGLNSINEGLFNGIPLIVIPQMFDQFDNAKKLEQLEAAICLDKNKINVDVLKNAVNNILVNKEKYKKGADKIIGSFNEARKNRKNIYQKIFI